MKTFTIRIAKEDHCVLSAISTETGESLTALLGRAVRLLKAQETMRQLDEDYARLKADREAWHGFRREMEAYDSTLVDGLEAETWGEEDFIERGGVDDDEPR